MLLKRGRLELIALPTNRFVKRPMRAMTDGHVRRSRHAFSITRSEVRRGIPGLFTVHCSQRKITGIHTVSIKNIVHRDIVIFTHHRISIVGLLEGETGLYREAPSDCPPPGPPLTSHPTTLDLPAANTAAAHASARNGMCVHT